MDLQQLQFFLIPVTGLRGLEEVEAPRFLDTRHTKVVRSSPLHTGRLYPPGISWYSFLEAESTPGTWTCRMLWEKKSLMTRAGIDPGTFRLVAQRLNHDATPDPLKVHEHLV